MTVDPKIPTAAESAVIGHLCHTYRDVIASTARGIFQMEARERLDDAAAEVRARLIQQGVRFLDRFVPGRVRGQDGDPRRVAADADAILRDLTASHGETRAVFRRWCKWVARWVFRDWVRAGRVAHLEVHVVADGADDEGGISFERLAAQPGSVTAPADTADEDAARDVVAQMLADATPDVRETVAMYLAALEAGDPRAVYRAHGTSMAVVERRLAALRPQAARAMADVGYSLGLGEAAEC